MGRLEGQLLRSLALRPFSWLRFIDDIDMKWPHGRETLTTFLDEANYFHPSIKFTAEISNMWHVFLDTKPSLVGDTISVDLYTNQKIHTSISYPHIATRNTAAKMFFTALHFASNVSAQIRTLLNQKQENWLSANGVIRNRTFHLPLRARQQKREDLLFYWPKSAERSPLRVDISQTNQKWGI